MAKQRGLFKIIIQEFIRSLTPKSVKHTLVGTDYFGTKYYEITQEIKSFHRNKPNRYFVPVNKDDFEQDMPAEWEAWLRGRRKVPPTEEEVLDNYHLIQSKKKNAALLEAKFAEQKDIQIVDPDAKPLDQHASLSFPVYEEYKNSGKNYVPKILQKKDKH